MYLHEHNEDWQELTLRTSKRFSLNQSFVIKDYFIYSVLKQIVFNHPDMVFKGGTSLSKCHNCINRFSEDVDLGLEVRHVTEAQRKRIKSAVVASLESLGLKVENMSEVRSRREYNKYLIPLPSLEGSLMSDTLIVETAVMTPASPAVIKTIDSFIYQMCAEEGLVEVIEEYKLAPFELKVNSIERTFVDKVFALCDYYLSEEIPPRQSRHLYDLYKIIPFISFDENLANLFKAVRNQRQGRHKCISANDGIDLAVVLDEIRESKAYLLDYETITAPLLYEEVSYVQAVSSIDDIVLFLRS